MTPFIFDVDVAEGFPLADFLSILNVHGTLNMVGLPDKELPGMMAQGFGKSQP